MLYRTRKERVPFKHPRRDIAKTARLLEKHNLRKV